MLDGQRNIQEHQYMFVYLMLDFLFKLKAIYENDHLF
jgi:hypothetical protein